jgi:hypothetical protein
MTTSLTLYLVDQDIVATISMEHQAVSALLEQLKDDSEPQSDVFCTTAFEESRVLPILAEELSADESAKLAQHYSCVKQLVHTFPHAEAGLPSLQNALGARQGVFVNLAGPITPLSAVSGSGSSPGGAL